MAIREKTAVVASCVLVLLVLVASVLFNLYGLWIAPWILAGMLAMSSALIVHNFMGGLQDSKISVGKLQLAGGAAALVGVWLLGNHFLATQLQPGDSLRARKVELGRVDGEIEVAKRELVHENQKLIRARQKTEDVARRQPAEEKAEKSLPESIAALDPKSSEAGAIRRLVSDRVGPWARRSGEADYMISVAGAQRGRVASACDDLKFNGEVVELTSLLIKEDQSYGSAEPVRVEKWRPLPPSVCERFQIQVSCEIARELLTEDVITCDNAGGFGWKAGFGGYMPVRAAVVVEEEENR